MNYFNLKCCIPFIISTLFSLAIVAQAVVTVVNTNDTGSGSLREAITTANQINGPVNIHFNIPGSGPHIIQNSTTPLPGLGAQKVIDATTQPNYYLGIIELRSSSQGFGEGIRITGNLCAVYGMKITNFGTGIRSNSAPINCTYLIGDANKGNHLYHNTIGIFVSNINNPVAIVKGNLIEGAPAPYKGRAINLQTSNNTVGGMLPGEGNIIKDHSEAFCNCNSIATNNIFRGNSTSCNNSGVTGSNGTAPTILAATTQTISGVATANSIIDLYRYSNENCPTINTCQGYQYLGTTTSASNGSWSIQIAPGLLQGGNRVSATNTQSGKSTSNYSACFTVVSVPTAPECADLQLPQPGSTNAPPRGTFFFWSPINEADGYILNIGLAPDNFDIVTDSVVTTNGFDLLNIDLPFDTEIFVKIIPFNSVGSAENCETFSFTTASQCPSGNVILQTQIEVFEFLLDYPYCTEIDGDLTISGTDIEDLRVLRNINHISGSLLIENNPILSSLDGLDNITSINGQVFIRNNIGLINLEGLNSLQSANGITIFNNQSLQTLNGLNSLSTISSVGISINKNPSLQDITALLTLQTVVGNISIEESGLESLTGLDNINPSGVLILTIINNPFLVACNSAFVCEYLSDVTNVYDILNNAGQCASPFHILSSCIEGDCVIPFGFTFTSQAQIDSFPLMYPGCTAIDGDIRLNGFGEPGIWNLDSLNQLEEIRGQLVILSTSLTDLTGLNNLRTANYLWIGFNNELESLQGLSSLESLELGIVLFSNNALTSMEGLNSLNSMGSLDIRYNASLIDLNGLEQLTNIFGYIGITNNASLQSLHGIDDVHFENNPLGSTHLFIYDNPLLEICGVPSICDFLERPDKIVSIYNNAEGCNSRTEVEESCTLAECTITCPDQITRCINEGSFQIQGATPIGGTFTGAGITGTLFDPSIAGAGIHLIEYQVNNPGCEGSCTFVIEVKSDPEIMNCPDGTVELDWSNGTCGAIVLYDVDLSGYPEPDINFQISGATEASGPGSGNGSYLNIGINQIQITATNDCYTAVCSFEVEVIDTIEPEITCPDNIYLLLDENCQAIVPSYFEFADYSDNCTELLSLSQFPEVGSVINGSHNETVQFYMEVMDEESNFSSCTFDVTLINELEGTFEIFGFEEIIINQSQTPSKTNGTEFGPTYLYQPITHEFEIVNTSCSEINLGGSFSTIDIIGTGSGRFAVTQNISEISLMPGESTTFSITYDAAEEGIHLAEVFVNAEELIYQFAIAGSAANVQMVVRGNSVLIENGAIEPNQSNLTDFGIVNFNTNRSRSFTIHNLRTSPLHLTGSPRVEITGEDADKFTVTTQPLSPVLSIQRSFSIRFDATEVGLFYATVVIENNDPTKNPYTFRIKASVPTPNMRVLGNNLIIENGSEEPSTSNLTDFGIRNLNTNTIHSFVVRNELGSGQLVLTGSPRVTITGPAAEMFTVATQPVMNIASGRTSLLRIRYTPLSQGVHHATVVIPNNDPNANPYTFAITGATPNALLYTNPKWQEESISTSVDPMTVYPNPFQNNFIIYAPLLEQTSPLLIMDALGKEVGNYLIYQGENNIEVQHLPSGVYYLIFPDLEESPKKLIKK